MFFYDSKIDPRRAQEKRDSLMIEPDKTAMANCPRQAIHHEWPKLIYNPHIIDQGID